MVRNGNLSGTVTRPLPHPFGEGWGFGVRFVYLVQEEATGLMAAFWIGDIFVPQNPRRHLWKFLFGAQNLSESLLKNGRAKEHFIYLSPHKHSKELNTFFANLL